MAFSTEQQDAQKLRKSAEGHIEHLHRLRAEWMKRRDEGDAVPSKEILTEWIRQLDSEIQTWEGQLKKALAPAPTPLA